MTYKKLVSSVFILVYKLIYPHCLKTYESLLCQVRIKGEMGG